MLETNKSKDALERRKIEMDRNYSFSDGITIYEFEDEAHEMCDILNREDDEGLLYLVNRWGNGWAIFIEDHDGISMGTY